MRKPVSDDVVAIPKVVRLMLDVIGVSVDVPG